MASQRQQPVWLGPSDSATRPLRFVLDALDPRHVVALLSANLSVCRQVPAPPFRVKSPPPSPISSRVRTCRRCGGAHRETKWIQADCRVAEVDRAIDNLIKSGKMFGGAGGRRESQPYPGPARTNPAFGKYARVWPGRQATSPARLLTFAWLDSVGVRPLWHHLSG